MLIVINYLLGGRDLTTSSLKIRCLDAKYVQVLIQARIETTYELAVLLNAKQSRYQLALVTWRSRRNTTKVIQSILFHEAETVFFVTGPQRISLCTAHRCQKAWCYMPP
ncbi:hypothetical protein ALP82_200114 [Pseudomonas savastanoi pv. fraxini]|nr:hypothetical protein ALP79_200047 [Pseudomonas savastanoi pv. fraxini]RMR70350.1 hypothetical protein ALP82_200114 [Pseudomonas savastanoi pv. fraxini]RMR75011.1 hypothetical protein ALP81_200133 [Pseudomonas savastanoi pv. fraxini]